MVKTKYKFDLVNLMIMYEDKEQEPLSVRELSLKTGICVNTLHSWYKNRIEPGKKQNISSIKIEQINILCDFFGCTVEELFKKENMI